MAQALTLSGTSIAADAPSGSVIGTFGADGVRFRGTRPPTLLIVGRLLVTVWDSPIAEGQIPIVVRAPTGPPWRFTITITPASVTQPPPSGATPVQITLTPTAVTLRDSAIAATKVATAAVKMSDGSAFAGVLSVSPLGLVAPSALDLRLARALTAADDGTGQSVVTASQNGAAVSANLAMTVIAAVSQPPPTRTLLLSINQSAPTIPDNSPAGTVIATASVKYSDGTLPTSATIVSSDPTFIGIKGLQLVLARGLTAADDGTRHVTITASDGLGALATARLGPPRLGPK